MNDFLIHGPVDTEIYSETSYGRLIFTSLLKGGSKVAMVDARTGKKLTYSDLKTKTLKTAFHLKKLGLKENDVISICSPNSLDFFIPAFAALYLGIIVAPINFVYVPREVTHALNISKPKVIFCTSGVLENILKAVKDIPSVQKVILIGEHSVQNNIDCLETILETKRILEPFQMPSFSQEHVAAIMCSSGTTGLPKGVTLTHKNFITAVTHLKKKGHAELTPDKISIGILPFFHAYGFTFYATNIIINMKVVVIDKFEEKLFLSSIEKYRISLLALVPPLVLFLAKHPMVDKYDVSSVEEVICAAAPLPKDIEDIVRKRLRLKVLRQGYGLTETTLAMTMTPLDFTKPGSSGVVVPSTVAKVINPETGKTLGPYEHGELCFKGPLIMKGYWNNPKATAEIIDKDGFLHTGDIGYYDDKKYFFIVDRLKELIKYKGHQVPPAEIEAILIQHPQIVDAAVIGIPDVESGELPKAFIVKAPNANLTEEEVRKYVDENVAYFKKLRGGVQFVESIPKNASGKILRRILRETLGSTSKL